MIAFPLIRLVVKGGNGIVEGSHVADVCPQPSIPEPLDELTQLGAIGYNDEVDSQVARGPHIGRAGDGHQRSSGANQSLQCRHHSLRRYERHTNRLNRSLGSG